MVYRGAMRIKCLAQGHTTENSSEARLEPPINLSIVIREAYPLDHWVLSVMGWDTPKPHTIDSQTFRLFLNV